MLLYNIGSKPIPDYGAATTQRQKQRAAGLHPDYWYPAQLLFSMRAEK